MFQHILNRINDFNSQRQDFLDPISLTGNLRMNHVQRLFETLILEDKLQIEKAKRSDFLAGLSTEDAKTFVKGLESEISKNLVRQYGGVVYYSERNEALNGALKRWITNFIAGEEAVPNDYKEASDNQKPKLQMGRNITLLLRKSNKLVDIGTEKEQPDPQDLSSTHFTVLNLVKNEDGKISIYYADSLGDSPVKRDKIPPVIIKILQDCGINSIEAQKDFDSTKQTDANCGYCAVFNALRMLNISTSQEDIDSFIATQRKFLESEFGKLSEQIADEEWDSSEVLTSTPNSSPYKFNRQNLYASDLSISPLFSDTSDSEDDSDSEETEEDDQSNSIQEDLDKSFSKLNISQIEISADTSKLFEVHGDDSSDEEDTQQKIMRYKSVKEAWEDFLSPRVYYGGREYPLIKQADEKYSVNIPSIGNWTGIILSEHNHLTDNNNGIISYIYFGPRECNYPLTTYSSDYRKKLFTEYNYTKLQASFELHYKGIQALYEDRVSKLYYVRKLKN